MDNLSYLAGIIDGEGSIVVSFLTGPANRHAGLDLKIVVGNTERDLIVWLHDNYGGRVTVSSRARLGIRDMHRWTLPIRSNRQLCMDLLDCVILKRRQLALALEAADLSIQRGSGRRVPPENLAKRTAIVKEVADLKKGLVNAGPEVRQHSSTERVPRP
jgi:hypothetical protein